MFTFAALVFKGIKQLITNISHMFAIVEIAGHQYKVQKDQQIYVNRLQGAEGDSVSFDRILLASDNDNVVVGAPVIEGASVAATIEKHLKADKVIVFKKKRRKGYTVKNGHRQYITAIKIGDINLNGAK
jgi:large subunit ribosomal protein L21